MVEFVSMSKAEAGEYLQRFLAEMDGCLDRFRRYAEATEGPRELDGSVASLDPLWQWAAGRFSWRDGYQPPELGMPGPRIDGSVLEPADELPSWFHHPSGVGYARFSAESLWLLDGLGRYLGSVVVDTVPKARWKAGNARAKGYLFQNQPVLAGLPDEVSPFHTLAIKASKLLHGNQPSDLRQTYEQWTGVAGR